MSLSRCLLLTLLFLAHPVLYAQDLILESGDRQTVVIELFTSEGCSSCPPAERYLNSYLEHPKLWKKFIPVAFHVDYWNYLGWKDRFSDPAHSLRQKQYARTGGLPGVYTPAFVVNGKGWRPRTMINYEPHLVLPDVGNLKVIVSEEGIEATFAPRDKVSQPVQLHVALLGLGLATKIKSGENRGRLSPHEFVVLGHMQHPVTSQAEGRQTWNVKTLPDTDIEAPSYALAVWVSKPGVNVPLQAVGGVIPAGYIH